MTENESTKATLHTPKSSEQRPADLSALDFVNLMIEITPDGSLPKVKIRPTYDDTISQQLITPPMHYAQVLTQLAEDLREKLKQNSKNSRFIQTVGNIRMRGTVFETEREKWVVLRRIPPLTFDVRKIGFSHTNTKLLQEWTDTPGLILISGGFCTGKTTTAASFFIDYLERNGGLGITAESPPEYFLQGTINDHALCFQLPLESDDDVQWAKTAADIRTAAPSIIYIGEILNSTIANITLDLAMTARPVIATIFGVDPADAIEHFVSLTSNNDEIAIEHKRRTLSRCLTGVSHQILADGKPTLRVLNVSGSENDNIRELIANNESLIEEIDRQNAQDSHFDHEQD